MLRASSPGRSAGTALIATVRPESRINSNPYFSNSGARSSNTAACAGVRSKVSGTSNCCDPLRLERTIFVEEYALVRNVLIDQQQPFIVSRDDETLLELAQRPDVRRE